MHITVYGTQNNKQTKKLMKQWKQKTYGKSLCGECLQKNQEKKQGKKQNDEILKQGKAKGTKSKDTYLSNLYPCNRDSARIVFVEVARQPNKAAQNPNILKLSSVTDVRRIPPTMGTKEAQIRQSKYFLQTSHCKTTDQIHLYQKQLQYDLKIILISKDGYTELYYP